MTAGDRPDADSAEPSPQSRCSSRRGVCLPSSTLPKRSPRSCGRSAEGSGPVAVDAERASGYRYSQRAYLVQLRRRGCRHRDHRPGGPAGPVRVGSRASRRRVGAARRQPGSALPRRGGHDPARHLRHRARWPAGRLRAGGARRDGRAGPRIRAGEGSLGGRLVDPAATRAVVAVRRARRRAAGRPARRSRGRARQAGQARLGAGGVRRDPRPLPRASRGPIRGGAPAASTGSGPAASSPPSASSGTPATSSPAAATSPPAGCCPTAPSSPRSWPTPPISTRCASCPSTPAPGSASSRPGGGRPWRRLPRCPTPRCRRPRRRAGRPAAAEPLGRTRHRRGGTADAGACRPQRHRRAARAAGRKPPRACAVPPARMEPARGVVGADRDPGPAGWQRQAVADRPGRRGAHRSARRAVILSVPRITAGTGLVLEPLTEATANALFSGGGGLACTPGWPHEDTLPAFAARAARRARPRLAGAARRRRRR